MTLLRLGVLDQGPIRRGGTVADSLQESMRLAHAVDEMGYERFWVAEHHDRFRFAIRTPETMMASLLPTTSLKVGAGGFMLLNHSPMRIAEVMAGLSALYGDRAEFALGRAPGGRPEEISRLRDGESQGGPRDFQSQLAKVLENLVFLGAAVGRENLIALASSTSSAEMAGKEGYSIAYGHFINNKDTIVATSAYDAATGGTRHRQRMICVSVICDPEPEERSLQVKHLALHLKRLKEDDQAPLPTLKDVQAYRFAAHERKELLSRIMDSGVLIGDPIHIVDQLAKLARTTGWSDYLVSIYGYDWSSRQRGYASLIEAANLKKS